MCERQPDQWASRAIYYSILFLAVLIASCTERYTQPVDYCKHLTCQKGAVTRSLMERKEIALVFTGDEFADGMDTILSTLEELRVSGSFFFTGNFYRNPAFRSGIEQLIEQDHYLGAHSDRHLLYCDWTNRDSLLVSKAEFLADLDANYQEMAMFGVGKKDAPFFLPPYEWYNQTISGWSAEYGLQLVNYTPGTISHADYTTPSMPNYRSTATILESIYAFEQDSPNGLNGFILLTHVGVSPDRTDKLYLHLSQLILDLRHRGYQFKRIDELLNP